MLKFHIHCTQKTLTKKLINLLILPLLLLPTFASAAKIQGQILVQNQGLAKAKLTLWQAGASGKAKKLQATRANSKGKFKFSNISKGPKVLYITSRGGNVNGKNLKSLTMLAVLGKTPANTIAINELTTIGSIWPNAQLLTGNKLGGSALALQAGSSNVKNLVDIKTGNYGKTLLDAGNLTSSNTMVRMNTLASLMDLCADPSKKGACKKLLNITGKNDTVSALTAIARQPWRQAGKLYSLYTQQFPVNKKTTQRTGAWQPYLQYEPKDFALMIRFEGGGIFAPGKLAFDKNGFLWSGQNWMPGSQSNVSRGMGGGTVRLTPCGKALSPALSGFRDGIDGVGWGTAASSDKIWISGFSHNIAVYSANGKHIKTLNKISNQSVGMLQGIGVGSDDDVWITDTTKAQLIYFPKANINKASIVKVANLKFPFAAAVDNNKRVWVTNSQSGNVVMFPTNNPKAAKSIATGGFGLRGIAIDSKGNAWVAVTTSPGFAGRINQSKASNIMQEFKEGIEDIIKYSSPKNPTGMLVMINPQGKVVGTFADHAGLYVPWGVSVDSDDHVWVANFMGQGVVDFCGVNTAKCPKGKKTGDIIHTYQSGVLQHITDNIVDAAGNVWAANNWDNIDAVASDNPAARISTNAGGKGIVVIYGIAKPPQ